MMLFANLFKRFSRTENKVLGRWTIEKCDNKINSKIDWSNTDHCGPCGTEKLINRESLKNNSSITTDIKYPIYK